MSISKLSYVLVPLIALSSSAMASPKGEADDDGSSFIVSEREKVTTPGGFSSVAEPAGPVDPEAAKRAAEEYAQKCILPQVEALMTMGLTPGLLRNALLKPTLARLWLQALPLSVTSK